MTVHVGEVTSEVVATASGTGDGDGGGGEAPSVWAERARTAAAIERLARDRLRTATGHGHD